MKRAKLQNELKRIQSEIKEEEARARSIVDKEKRRLCDKFGFKYVTSECVKKDDAVYYLSYDVFYKISQVKIQYFSYLPIDVDFKDNEKCVINSEIKLKGLHLSEFQKIS